MIIENDKVVLEPLAHTHASALIDTVRDGGLWRIPNAGVPHASQIRGFISANLDRERYGVSRLFVVWDRREQRIVGVTGLYGIDRRKAEIWNGIAWVAGSHQNRGCNQAWLPVLAKYCVKELGLRFMKWDVSVSNIAPQRVIERVGGTLVGTMRDKCRYELCWEMTT